MIPAAVAAATAAWILLWSPGAGTGPAARSPHARRLLGAVTLAFVGLGAGYVAGGAHGLAWAACLFVAVGTGLWGVRRRRLRLTRERREDAAARASTSLSMLLRAGQLPGAALARAALTHQVLVPVASVARLGGDVTDALLVQGEIEGQEALRSLAAAWRISERTGAPIADAVATVAEGIRLKREVGRQMAAELASARASAHVMAMLPVAALGLGTIVGANPVGVLVAGPWGPGFVLAAVALTAAGVVWSERIVTSAGRCT